MRGIFKPKLYSLWKQGIGKKTFYKDILAGIIVGVVALPLSIAFAVATGLSPEKGLITAIVAGFLISALGGSRVQIGGPTGAFVIVIYGIVENYGYQGLVISTILAGIILVVFGLLKFGSLLKYIPYPLIIGFTSGIALIIFTIQIKDAFGLQIDKLPSGFIEKWSVLIDNLHTLNYTSLIITIITIICTVYVKKLVKNLPGSFVAIILITLVVSIFQIDVTTIGDLFGEIPTNIHIELPIFKGIQIENYIVPALTIALLGGIESLLSAVVSDGMIGGNHRSNTELIAQGIANIITPIFGGIPATGAIARTATNVHNGGRTPLSGIFHSITLLLIMLLFGKWASLIPMSCLAGILMVVAFNMSEWRSFADILKGSVYDKLVLITTFILTVLVDLSIAIEVGIVMSALIFMKRMSLLNQNLTGEVDIDIIEMYPDLPENILIYEISGPFFFASAKQYSETIKQLGISKEILILRMRHVPFIDATGIQNLKGLIQKLKQQNTKVILSGVNENVLADLEKSEVFANFERKNVFNKFNDAVLYAQKIMNANKN